MKISENGGFELSRPEIAALLAHASTDKTRADLCGVHFVLTPAGGFVEASDGHRLLRNAFQGPPLGARDADWIASRADVGAAADACRRVKGDFVRFLPGGYEIVVWPGLVSAEHSRETRPVGAKFPPCSHFFAEAPAWDGLGLPSEVSGAYFADIGLVSAAANTEWIRETLPSCKTAKERAALRAQARYGIQIFPARGELDPVRFACGSWRVVLMPRRADAPQRDSFERVVRRTFEAECQPPKRPTKGAA
jgi:hypothetical protein